MTDRNRRRPHRPGKGLPRLLRTGAVLAATVCAVLAAVLFPSQSVRAQETPQPVQCNIIYDFGNGQYYAVTSLIAMSMMMTNPDGSYYIDPSTQYYVVDENKTRAFLTALQDMYPQESDTLSFQTTLGDVVQVQGGTMTKRFLDEDAEYLYLAQAMMEQRQEVHVPQYGIGKTYIELDMTNQMLYYYQHGVRKVETPIVTGNLAKGYDSPAGVYYLRAKMRDQVLRSGKPKDDPEYYESPVSYWMPYIANSIGIHDATWRSRFGGEIYKTSGSHGCINVPYASMNELFPMVEVGTPIVAFYR
ncbi:MAG: L,D-transpeptidase [Eubacteriales bacterium]|nr:L,D-transpeptidase [Eubacteriales bacterium]